MFKHPRYNGFTINNDILLIKLASPAQMNMRVSPVCVAQAGDNFPGGMKCVTSGWGLTRHNGQDTAAPGALSGRPLRSGPDPHPDPAFAFQLPTRRPSCSRPPCRC